MKSSLVAVAFCIVMAGCAISPLAKLQKHPARHLSGWGHLPEAVPLAQKTQPVPAMLVDFINLDNSVNGYPERPKAAPLTDEFKADIVQAVTELPAPLQRQISERLYGIYLVTGLGGTALTDVVVSDDHTVVGTFLLLDRAMLDRVANDWASWKESTPFKPEPSWEVRLTIERGKYNSRANAIQYILLHEFGHVLSTNEKFHPLWHEAPRDVRMTEFPFASLSWTVEKERYVGLSDKSFPERSKIVYYFGDPDKKPPISTASAVYEKLGATRFPTLYASTNPFDDFAESFASYVHVVRLKKPWQLEIKNAGKTVARYGPCWNVERCRQKREILEKFLAK